VATNVHLQEVSETSYWHRFLIYIFMVGQFTLGCANCMQNFITVVPNFTIE